jgi:hypothetical protein
MPKHYIGKTGAEKEEALREHQEQTGEGMPYTPFKMKGFSGFGNSPAKQIPSGRIKRGIKKFEKLVKRGKKLRTKKETREDADKGTKIIDWRIKRNQKRIKRQMKKAGNYLIKKILK